METTTDTQSKITLFIEKILSYKTLFLDIVATIGYALSPAVSKNLQAALVKICTSGGGPLFQSSYDSVVGRKMLPTQFVFHRPEHMEVRRRQIRTIGWVWYNSPTKIDNVLHVLQTAIVPGPILFQEKSLLLLWPDSGNSSLQLSQRRNVAVRVDGLSGFKEIQKDHNFTTTKDSAHHFAR